MRTLQESPRRVLPAIGSAIRCLVLLWMLLASVALVVASASTLLGTAPIRDIVIVWASLLIALLFFPLLARLFLLWVRELRPDLERLDSRLAERRLGAVEVRLEPDKLRAGETARLFLEMAPADGVEVQHILVTLSERETKYLQGRQRRDGFWPKSTERLLHRQICLQLDGPEAIGQRLQLHCDLTPPQDALGSVVAAGGRANVVVTWTVDVHIGIRRWPDWRAHFPVHVIGDPRAVENARASATQATREARHLRDVRQSQHRRRSAMWGVACGLGLLLLACTAWGFQIHKGFVHGRWLWGSMVVVFVIFGLPGLVVTRAAWRDLREQEYQMEDTDPPGGTAPT